MEILTQLFDRMDERRHLPNYQLERRADLLFSLYLPQALEAKLGFPVRADLVPEFPVRIGTIYPRIPINKSFKIDYLALSTSGDHAVFVELKTDGHSRRAKQDEYLAAERRTVGLARRPPDDLPGDTGKAQVLSLAQAFVPPRLARHPRQDV